MITRQLRVAVGALATLALGLVGGGVATGATPPPPSGHSSTYSAVRAGTAGQSHGIEKVCADAHLACLSEALTTSPGSSTLLSTSKPQGYGAGELQAAYHLTGKGTRGTIAIIDAGADPELESDVATYRKQYDLPPCTTKNGCFQQVSMTGKAPLKPDPKQPAAEESVAVETSLDMDAASAACPHCTLLEVQVPIGDAFLDPDHPKAHGATDDFGTAVETAVQMGADAVSISYAFPSDQHNDTVAGKKLFQPGTAVLASSGDSGFNNPSESGPVPIGAPWPQNLPWVTSTGGTTLYAPSATKPGYSETAWSGAGSGCDPALDPAEGQPAAVSRQCNGHRAGSDISADADPITGLAVYDTYAPASGDPYDWIVVGGTSASSPLIAGMYARAGHTSGVTGPNRLYAKPAGAFNDVTLGQNAVGGTCQRAGFAKRVCVAGPKWDGPTGRGSPKGLAPFT
jgi:hypothetical protein